MEQRVLNQESSRQIVGSLIKVHVIKIRIQYKQGLNKQSIKKGLKEMGYEGSSYQDSCTSLSQRPIFHLCFMYNHILIAFVH